MKNNPSGTISLLPLSWYRLLATFFGAGCSPVAPGTVGTLAAVLLYLLLMQLPVYWFLICSVAIIAMGTVASERLSRDLGEHDHGGIVIDEVGGYLVTMAFVPLDVAYVVAGFILFRIFDIVKPWPIRWADKRVAGGFGIMLDDLIAGVFANLLLWILILNEWM